MRSTEAYDPRQDRSFAGHPKGLFVLFAAEMWERFSFYGMRSLLVLYLTKHFLFSDEISAGVYGAYLGLTYALPVLGGYFADRYLGARRAVVFGGVLLCLGHLAMAYEGTPAEYVGDDLVQDLFAVDVLFLALSLISVGVGFLKPNISTLVGSLYPARDPRRDSGFTIFYMGINVGAFAATLVVGTLGTNYGWGYGFGLAGIGMVVGLSIFLWGQKYLGGAGDPPKAALEAPPVFAMLRLKHPLFAMVRAEHLVYAFSVPMLVACWFLMQKEHLVGPGLLITLALAYGYVLWQAFTKLTPRQGANISAVLILTFLSVTFWALFEQAGSSINLFTDRVVDRGFAGIEVATPVFQSFNPGFIMLLAPGFATLWMWLARRGWEPGLAVKFGLGIAQAGLGFAALVAGVSLVGEDGMVSMWWVVLAYLLHTTGELCLSPVGLSMVTRLTPAHLVGLMMGCWFLATAFADWVSGQLAKLAAIDRSLLESGDIAQQMATYNELFLNLAIGGVGIGVLVIVLSPLINRLAAEGDEEAEEERPATP